MEVSSKAKQEKKRLSSFRKQPLHGTTSSFQQQKIGRGSPASLSYIFGLTGGCDSYKVSDMLENVWPVRRRAIAVVLKQNTSSFLFTIGFFSVSVAFDIVVCSLQPVSVDTVE